LIRRTGYFFLEGAIGGAPSHFVACEARYGRITIAALFFTQDMSTFNAGINLRALGVWPVGLLGAPTAICRPYIREKSRAA
jgi:hypothetical protein